MGTTLTGTTPQDTYDSLIKVTDNGPLSGTAKYLSDGLGNDSKLALSTGNIGINTTTPDIFGRFYTYSLGLDSSGTTAFQIDGTSYSIIDMGANGVRLGFISQSGTETSLGNLTAIPLAFLTNGAERMRITSAGNVGIGTSSPEAKLDIKGEALAGSVGMFIENISGSTLNNSADIYFGTWGGSTIAGVTNARISAVNVNAGNAESNIDFYTYNGASSGKRVSITSNGLTFNGDTAAANALDDYEEGTWTMGLSFGGNAVGVTASAFTGTYTKIGRKVSVTGALFLTSKGSSTGAARITGLPFTIPNTAQFYSSPSLYFDAITFTNQFQGYGVPNTTTIDLREITLLGTDGALNDGDFANNSAIIISFTYNV